MIGIDIVCTSADALGFVLIKIWRNAAFSLLNEPIADLRATTLPVKIRLLLRFA
ncbi:hypothetical protein ECO26H__500168 [Escherichia coli O26:H11]|nr:hypothetical protein ECO26H__500168 [Escherichia coli O26:H11]